MSDDLTGNDNTNTQDTGSTTTPPDWKTQLGDLAQNDRVKGFNSMQDLAKAYIDSPQPVKLPESHEGYKLPENVKIKGLRRMALEHKLSQDQLDGILKFNSNAVNQGREAAKKYREESEAKLKSEWGDNYEKNIKAATQALSSLDKEKEMLNFLNSTGMANDPRVIKFLHKVSGSLKEGGFVGSEGNTKKAKKSHAEALFPNHPGG